MEKYFLGFSIRSFPRSQDKHADVLAKAAAQYDPLPPDVFFKTLKQGSVNHAEEPKKFINAITSEDWKATIFADTSSRKMTRKKRGWLFAPEHIESSTKTCTKGGLRASLKVHFS